MNAIRKRENETARKRGKLVDSHPLVSVFSMSLRILSASEAAVWKRIAGTIWGAPKERIA